MFSQNISKLENYRIIISGWNSDFAQSSMSMSNFEYAWESWYEATHEVEIGVEILFDDWKVVLAQFPLNCEHVGKHPWLILEIVNRPQRIHRVQTSVHKGQQGVLHTEGNYNNFQSFSLKIILSTLP